MVILDYFHRLYIDYIYMTFYGFRNLWRWKGIIWHDSQFDYSFLLIILIKKLELMENSFRNYGCAVGSKRIAQEIKITRLLAERIQAEDYAYKTHFNKTDYCHAEYLIKQDIEYFTKIINKKLRTWWD